MHSLVTNLTRPLALGALCAGLLACLPACLETGDPPAPRLVLGGGAPATPATPRPTPEPAERPTWNRPEPEPALPTQDPVGAVPNPRGPRLGDATLPPAWPRDVGAALGVAFARRVLVSERVVGLAAWADGGFWAVGAEGGQFEADALGRPVALRTELAPGILRVESGSGLRVACRADGARWSMDGRPFETAPFACGFDGRHSLMVDNGRVWVLSGGRVHRGDPRSGRYVAFDLPLLEPQVVTAADEGVVVFGPEGAAWSADGGDHFERSQWPIDAPAIRDAVFVGKARVYGVGDDRGKGPAVVSDDGGKSFEIIEAFPRRFEHLRAVAVDAQGAVVAVTALGDEGVVRTDSLGRFVPVDAGGPVGGAVVAHARAGVVVGSPQGVARELGAGPRGVLGLDGPLWRAVFTHPQVGVAAGLAEGLFRTEDGGRTWTRVPGSAGLNFTGLATDGGHRVWAVGPSRLWQGFDGGRRFVPRAPPSRCVDPDLSFAPQGGAGLIACAQGATLRTADGGQTWTEGAILSQGIVAPRFLDHATVVARVKDHAEHLWFSHDAGASWALVAGPAPVRDLSVARAGSRWALSLVDASGGRWSLAAGRHWEVVARAGTFAHAVGHAVAEDGRVVHTDGEAVWVDDRRVAHAAEAFGLHLTGDGAVLVFEAASTTLLEPL